MNCPILTSSLPASVATLESGWKQAPHGVTWAAHSQMRWGCAVLLSTPFRLYQIWLLLFGCYFHMWLQRVLDSCVKFTLYPVMLILYAWYTALTVTIMQYNVIDHFTGRQRLARFASLLDNVAEWHCFCINDAEFLKVQSLWMHQIWGSHCISALEIMFVLHNMYVFDRGSLCQKNRRQRSNRGFVSPHIKCM